MLRSGSDTRGHRFFFVGLSVAVLLLLAVGLLLRADPDLPVRLSIPLDRSLIPLHYLDLVGIVLFLLLLYAAFQRFRCERLTQDVTKGRAEVESTLLELEEVHSIFEVSSRVNSFRDIEDALAFIARAARECLAADRSALLLVEGEELEVRAVHGDSPAHTPGARQRIGEGVAGWVARNRRSLLLNDAEDLRRFFPDQPAEGRIAPSLCVPLQLDGDTIGVLSVARAKGGASHRFDDRQRKLLTIFADYAAGTIRSLRTLAELRRAHEELKASSRRAEELQDQLIHAEKLSTLGQLIAEIGHELSNPLTSMIGYAEVLALQIEEPDAVRSLDTIQREGRRCQKTVKGLLNFARRHRGELTRVNVNELVEEAVEFRLPRLRRRSIEVELHLQEDLPPIVADPTRLQQVFLNLLNNSIHAIEQSDSGPARIRFESRFRTGTRTILVRVSDTGPGIPEGDEGRIFEPFFSTKEPGKGTGLGLPVCRGIVEPLGGRIEVSGNPEGGATFTVSLPLPFRPAGEADAGDESAGYSCSGLCLLVVDPDPAVRELLSLSLEADGNLVSAVGSVAAALGAVQNGCFDAILTAYDGEDGSESELYRGLQEESPALSERIVFLCEDPGDPRTAEEIERTGQPSVVKPFTMEEIRGAVRHVILGAGAPEARSSGPTGDSDRCPQPC